jgi:hypothetical protein
LRKLLKHWLPDLDGDQFEVGETTTSNLATKAGLVRAAIGKALVRRPLTDASRRLGELRG